MNGDAQRTDDQYETTYRATRDAIRSLLGTGVLGVLLCAVGVVGVSILWMTVTAVASSTATWVTYVAGLFGAATTTFAGYELYYL